MAGYRYGFISGACQEAVRSTIEVRYRGSDRIDSIVTNRLLGLPIFLGLMYFVFYLTFSLGDPPRKWIEGAFGWLGGIVAGLWPKGSESALKSLLVDGIIGGVGGVIVFLPNILLLFLAIAMLEDTGYMARAAFIMDRLMHKIGLARQELHPHADRLRLHRPGHHGHAHPGEPARPADDHAGDPAHELRGAAADLRAHHPGLLPAGLAGADALGDLPDRHPPGRRAGETPPEHPAQGRVRAFVMELPPYRMPTIKGILIHMWERGWLYLKKAGTIILCIAILMWAMTSYPKKPVFDRDYEAEGDRIEAAYLSGVKSMNGEFDLPDESNVLVGAMRAELVMAAEQEKFYGNEPGFAAAEKEKEAALEALARSNDGKVLTEFLRVRDLMRKVRADFQEAVEKGEIKEGSPEYSALTQTRDEALKRIEKAHPDFVAPVALYLDDAEGPFKEKRLELEQAKQAEELSYSIAGRIGQAIEPVLRPMGFDWRIGTALIGSFAAKEVFVVQMGIVYSVGKGSDQSESLRKELRSHYSPLVAFCIMIYCLISTPCMATITMTGRESGSWKWALFQLAGLTVTAYVLTTLVFQAGRLAGVGV